MPEHPEGSRCNSWSVFLWAIGRFGREAAGEGILSHVALISTEADIIVAEVKLPGFWSYSGTHATLISHCPSYSSE